VATTFLERLRAALDPQYRRRLQVLDTPFDDGLRPPQRGVVSDDRALGVKPVLTTVTILNGQTTSDFVDTQGLTVCAVFLPAGFAGSVLAFTASPDGVAAYVTLQSGGADYAVGGVIASRCVILDPSVFAPLRFLKFVGGVQTADRTLTLVLRPV
jgi:hypothetical protein